MDELLADFPALRIEPFSITSQATNDYNCVAWAADRTDARWWPEEDSYWPEGIPCVDTLDAFIQAFRALGYERCETGEHEAGFERVAIYAKFEEDPKHVARQLATGEWTSKLGKGVDISHPLTALEGDLYGKVVVFMKRQSSPPSEATPGRASSPASESS